MLSAINPLLWLYWDPSREAFYIPYFHHPVTWYGILFALGFLISYFIVKNIWKRRLTEQYAAQFETSSAISEKATQLTDRMTVYMVIGTVVGARLGEVFFYEFSHYLHHPLDVFKIWEGGLASHGAVLGIMASLTVFWYRVKNELPQLKWLAVIDTIAITASAACVCIRIGNFINQEILGTPSNMPWAVIFGHPWSGDPAVPRHAVQLYEAGAYLIIFLILAFLWKKRGTQIRDGFYSGLFFTLTFGSRFVIEIFKLPQSSQASSSYWEGLLSTGQWLSIPFFLVGLYLLLKCRARPSSDFLHG